MSSELQTFNVKEFLLSKPAGAMYVAIFVLGMFAPAFFDVDALAPSVMAVKFLGIPIFGLCLYAFLGKGRGPKEIGVGIFFALICSLFLLMEASGYLFIFNVIGPGQSETLVEGKIVRLRDTGAKIRRHEVTIVDAAGKRIELDVDYPEYRTLAVGQTYSARWKVGTLGIKYK